MSLAKLFRLFAPVAALLIAAPAAAQGDLLVAPTRVVISGAGSAEVVLSNIGKVPATYRIGVELRRMGTDGEFDEIAEVDANATEKAAIAMLRYAPKRITLLPGQPQAVRLSARPASELPDGEYRVHMSFRAVPPAVSAEEAAAAEAAGQVAIRLTPVYGITIPIFVRKGRLEVKATLANPRIVAQSGHSFLELDMTRTGTRSVFGEIIGKGAGGQVLFTLKGLAIYPEIDRRTARIPLSPEQVVQVKGKRVTIEYRELPENGGQLIATTTSSVG